MIVMLQLSSIIILLSFACTHHSQVFLGESLFLAVLLDQPSHLQTNLSICSQRRANIFDNIFNKLSLHWRKTPSATKTQFPNQHHATQDTSFTNMFPTDHSRASCSVSLASMLWSTEGVCCWFNLSPRWQKLSLIHISSTNQLHC